MAGKTCDITKLRSVAMSKAQAKMRELRAAGIPIDSETYSKLMKMGYAEGRAECAPASNELTVDQMELVKQVCPVCADKFRVNKGLKLRLAEIISSGIVPEPSDGGSKGS